MTDPRLHGVYAITDAKLMPTTDQLLTQVELALRGGVRLVQYRDKSDDRVKRYAQAQALNALCQHYSIPLLINDDIELARLVSAAGVHLGQSDGTLAEARSALGEDALIGITCHDQIQLARAAVAGGANYVAFGAFFPSSTKPSAIRAPLSLLSAARAELNCPIVAIGGISVDNASQVISAGADMIAVVNALFAPGETESRAHSLSRLFSESPDSPVQ
ncbi:MAG: thiamine phosphate synthase [Oceanospirillaceae bacterium]|nr:thiamine phosphate synthase [Oceanospirillaceae bacterium]